MRYPGPILFFGTPDFAVPTLDALNTAGAPPGLVVTQPARAVGRGRRIRQSPVAARGGELGLGVAAVASLGDEGVLERLQRLEPWVIVVVAFGQILPGSVLSIPTAGCINVHASLLPRYRGAAPIQAAIAAGDRTTGVTTMQMTAGLDEGPILLQQEIEIGPEATAPRVAERLSELGAELLITTLDGLAQGSLTAREQVDSQASYAPRLKKSDGLVDWGLGAGTLFNRWRAYTPWPGLTASLGAAPIKIVRCRLAEPEADGESLPGVIRRVDPDLSVACGEGSALILEQLQRPGRRVVSGTDLANGERLRAGDAFDTGEPE